MVRVNRSLEPRQQNDANVPEDEVHDEFQVPLQGGEDYQQDQEELGEIQQGGNNEKGEQVLNLAPGALPVSQEQVQVPEEKQGELQTPNKESSNINRVH